MKYILKKMSVILCMAIMLVTFLPINNVKAENFPNTITGITKDEVLNYSGTSMYYKKYANGVLFCSTFHIQNVGTSCTISSSQWSVATQAGVAAIVNKYNSAPSKQAYYNAELAMNEFIYYYETHNSVNKIKSDSEVRNISGVKEFYDAAVSAYNDAKKKFEISVATESGTLDFTLNSEYYVSNKINVSGTTEYEVAMSGVDGLEVYNQKDNSFYVRFPSSNVENGSNVTVKVAVKGVKAFQVAKKYNCGGGNQELVPNLVDKLKINAAASISGSITKNNVTKLKISKQDIATKQELKGATLSIYNSSDELIDTWETGDEPYYKEGLPVGDYYIVETKAPEGYTLSDEKISFSLIDDGNVKDVVVYNSHNDKYKVKISKQDITTKQELPGATLVLKDSQGNEITRWVTSDKPYELELEKGEYTLTEIQAPNGYDLSYEVIKFTVGEENEVETTVVMYNSKTPDTGDKNILFIISFMIMATAGVGFSIYKLKTQK